MSAPSTTHRPLPIFCHISEYGREGYLNLHRLIASSSPLILWAPASTMLELPDCRVGPSDFLYYLDRGDVRIVARHDWIWNRTYRNQHRWAAARWNNAVDGAVQSICRNDDRLPIEDRRVSVAPPEDGYQWAENFLHKNPTYIERLYRLFRSSRGRTHLPPGTYDRARAIGSDPDAIARIILRDARNHGMAKRIARARFPFLLARQDSQFLRWLEKAEEQSGSSATERPRRSIGELTENETQLTEQLMDLLHRLESMKGSQTLREFMKGEGHDLLVSWFERWCDLVASGSLEAGNHLLLDELLRDIEQGKFKNRLLDVMDGRSGLAITTAGLLLSAIGLWAEPSAPLTIAGFGVSALPVGTGLCKKLGWIRTDYTGPAWPFLYAFGHEPDRRAVGAMREVMQAAKAERGVTQR